jgi:hypothetical protein
MTRKVLLGFAAVALPTVLLVTVGSGVAQAARENPVILPGSVTCTNNWTGVIKFNPPLKTGGTATSEVFTVKAKLGNTAAPCGTSAGSVELGTIKGKLKFVVPAPGGANNCTTIFSGGPIVPVLASRFKLKWSAPPGAPSIWKQPPPFSVVGTLGAPSTIAVSGGIVTGSFAAPPPAPNASLSGPAANWAGAAITGACGTTAGLASLPLSAPSTGTW